LLIRHSGTNFEEKLLSVVVLVQGTPYPERQEALAEYQQTAHAINAKHGGQMVALGAGLGVFTVRASSTLAP
jgi:hypothetical protein